MPTRSARALAAATLLPLSLASLSAAAPQEVSTGAQVGYPAPSKPAPEKPKPRDSAPTREPGSTEPGAAAPVRATLADVSWIAGRWVGTLDGGTSEEIWRPPAGDSMMGMYRFVKDGKAVFYEFLLIEQGEAGPVMKFKHFSPGLIGWEEKDEVVTCPLVKLAPGEAVFERRDDAKGIFTRLTYTQPAADELSVLLEKKNKDGSPRRSEFRFKKER